MDLTYDQRATLICHELLHILLGHHLRMRGKDGETWNSACDYVINLILRNSGFKPIDNWLYDTKYTGMSAEDVYALLMRKEKQERESINNQSQSTGGSFSEPKASDGTPMNDSELKEAESQIEIEARQAYAQLSRRINGIKNSESLNSDEKNERLREIGAGIKDYRERVSDINKSKINWRDVIRNFLFDEGASEIDDETFDVYEMEAQDFDIVINDYRSREFGDVALCTDVSSSLIYESKQVASEIFHALEFNKSNNIKLYQISDFIHTNKKITDVSEIELVRGGGTDFDVFFNDECYSETFDSRGIIFVTDGYVDFSHWETPNVPVLWILTRANSHFEKNVPFGDVVRMNN